MYHEAIEKVSKQVLIRDRYDNFIGGKWVAPKKDAISTIRTPVTGKQLCSVPRSSAADIELALDAAHKAKDAWGKTSVAERSLILNKIADKMEANLTCSRWPRRSTTASRSARRPPADMPLVVDHWRYFASVRPRPGRRHLRDRSRNRRLSLSTSRSAWSARSFPGTSRS